MITQSSGGFSFREDPTMPPEKTGYTSLDTKTIYYNPIYFYGSKELGIEPEPHPEGFFYHEAGHHTPDVVILQNRMLDDLKNIEIPESYRGDPQTEERFLQSIYKYLDNSIADIWLESYMSRRPYYPVRQAITEFQKRKGEMTQAHAKKISKPEQLIQGLLSSRYQDQDLAETLDPDVYDSYRTIIKRGAMRVLTDAGAFENYFASPSDHKQLIDRKFAAYREVLLPEYLKLMEAELEERKQQKKDGKGAAGQGAGSAVPLTKEEEQELVNKILTQLEAAGHECNTMSKEEKKYVNHVFGQIKSQLQNKEQNKQESAGRGPKIKIGIEAIEAAARLLEQDAKDKKQRGLAEALQVRQESIQTWERIKEKYKLEIESTASVLSEIFLDDRRKRMQYIVREGEIVPGLEKETIAAMIAGDLDPDTKMREVRNPEFIEVETEWIVDNSGSMAGENIEKSIDLMVIVIEAFKKVREDLEAENLVMINEEPVRIGVTKFTVFPQRVTTLAQSLNEEKELRIIDEISQIGGGTDEAETIDTVYKELTLGKKNVIKLIFVLSDGAGNKDGVAPIIRQIEEDDEVILLAMGLGSGADQVVETYVEPLKKFTQTSTTHYINPKTGERTTAPMEFATRASEGTNVFGFAAHNPEDMLPYALDFLKKQVEKKKREIIY